MTKHCTLKESFIETQLDKFQPAWRNGEDITAETKQKIRDYVTSKLPDELKDDVSCITDYSIWHMAKKIREREDLPEPKKSNKGKKVSIRKSSNGEQRAETITFSDELEAVRKLTSIFSLQAIKDAVNVIESEKHEEPSAPCIG